MIVAGLGFRAGASADDLQAALDAALAAAPGAGSTGRGADKHVLDALATAAQKARAPALTELAEALGLPVIAIAPEVLAAQDVPSHSPRVAARFGAGSLAEAAALAGAGTGARLWAPRAVAPGGRAVAAIAEGEGS